jgi:guanylate kinase
LFGEAAKAFCRGCFVKKQLIVGCERKDSRMKNICSEKKILLIDGYAASGKSICLGLIQNILNNDFCYLPKYSTRLPRVNENNGDIFCETFFLNEYEFNKKNISHIYNKTGALYGMNLNDINSYLNLGKNIFLIANDFFRKEVRKLYGNKNPIIEVFIQSPRKIRFNRILEANLGNKQKEQRLKRFYSNKKREMNNFDYVIRNKSSISFLKDELYRLIDCLY